MDLLQILVRMKIGSLKSCKNPQKTVFRLLSLKIYCYYLYTCQITVSSKNCLSGKPWTDRRSYVHIETTRASSLQRHPKNEGLNMFFITTSTRWLIIYQETLSIFVNNPIMAINTKLSTFNIHTKHTDSLDQCLHLQNLDYKPLY